MIEYGNQISLIGAYQVAKMVLSISYRIWE